MFWELEVGLFAVQLSYGGNKYFLTCYGACELFEGSFF